MARPYFDLQNLTHTDDATTLAIYLLRQYVTGRPESVPDIMSILAKLEDDRPALEAACDQMRSAFSVPPWDREQKIWLNRKAFNMIVLEINKAGLAQTSYTTPPERNPDMAAA